VFLDPVHKVPIFLVSWYNFLNFLIKNNLFVLLIISLNIFQSKLNLDEWYMFSFLLHSLVHHTLECLVILTYLEYLFQRFSEIATNSCIILFSNSLWEMLVVLMLLTIFLSSLTKHSFFTLFLMIFCYLSWINFSLIMMSTIKRVWSEELCKLGKIK